MARSPKGGTSLADMIFHLLHRASQRADDLFGKGISEAELTARQFAVLLAVSGSEDPSQADIVGATGIDRSTTADLIRRMVRKGLLQRTRSRQDRRAKIVRLTSAGHATLVAAKRNAGRVDAALLARLSGDQREALIEALKAMSAE